MEGNADAAVVEAEQDALGDEQSLDLVAVVLEDEAISAQCAVGGVAEDARHDDSGELGEATEAVTAGTDAKERHPEDANHDAEGEDAQEQVHDRVEREQRGPLSVEHGSGNNGRPTSLGGNCVESGAKAGKAAGVVSAFTEQSVNVLGVSPHAPVNTAEGGTDDQGEHSAAGDESSGTRRVTSVLSEVLRHLNFVSF